MEQRRFALRAEIWEQLGFPNTESDHDQDTDPSSGSTRVHCDTDPSLDTQPDGVPQADRDRHSQARDSNADVTPNQIWARRAGVGALSLRDCRR